MAVSGRDREGPAGHLRVLTTGRSDTHRGAASRSPLLYCAMQNEHACMKGQGLVRPRRPAGLCNWSRGACQGLHSICVGSRPRSGVSPVGLDVAGSAQGPQIGESRGIAPAVQRANVVDLQPARLAAGLAPPAVTIQRGHADHLPPGAIHWHAPRNRQAGRTTLRPATGKSRIACARARKAGLEGHQVRYQRVSGLMTALKIAYGESAISRPCRDRARIKGGAR